MSSGKIMVMAGRGGNLGRQRNVVQVCCVLQDVEIVQIRARRLDQAEKPRILRQTMSLQKLAASCEFWHTTSSSTSIRILELSCT